MFSKLGLKAVTFLTAIGVVLLFCLLGVLFFDFSLDLRGCLGIILGLILSYGLFYYVLTNVIFERIKPIYKVIRSSRKKGKIVSERNSAKIIEEVESRVSDWLEETESKVETMEKLESYRREYIGNISHELKTPLFNIQGFVLSLLDGAMHDDKFLTTYLERARANVDRLLTIVEDLDDITKLESGVMTLDITSFDINTISRQVISELSDLAVKKNVQLKIDSPPEDVIMVKADHEAIRQVISNLLVNSIKYSKEGGQTNISFHSLDNEYLVEVRDDGIGISKEHLDHLFDRFYRVDKSRSRLQGGSGLGLSIVKHYIEAHNQTITVRSTPEEGSTFGFTLEKG